MTTKLQEQVMALAGVFQAAAQVDQVARTGQNDTIAFEAAIASVLEQNPADTESVYGSRIHLRCGLEKLRDVLRSSPSPDDAMILRYALGILHLQNKMKSNAEMMEVIGSRVSQAIDQAKHFGSPTHENVIANLAGIYQDTFSNLKFRIQVTGDPTYLQQNHIANRVRGLLLAGIRSATLWRQLGGSRLQIFFRRKKLLKETENLLNA